MDWHLYAGFIAATLLLVAVPGPLVALIVATTLAQGRRAGLLTVAGAAAATLLHLAAVALGMTLLLDSLAPWFGLIHAIAGAGVILIGLQAWRAARAPAAPCLRPAPPARWSAPRAGFLLALLNPKAMLFYATFFPEFLTPAFPTGPQLVLLSATLLAIGITSDTAWALLAAHLRPLLHTHAALRQRAMGAMLVSLGAGLALLH